jgi:Flp pilus assembly pilin Flp
MQNLKNNRGQGLVEYILIVVVMALLAIGGMRALGKNTHNAFVQASGALSSDMQNASGSGASGNYMQ